MKILSISTSSNIASVCISEDDNCILELNIDNNKKHSETLMPLVSTLFSKTNLKLSDINLIACDIGPGSFTGIRIGISTIKAIAESLNIPVVGISSLEALSYNIRNSKCNAICSLIDARNNQVYCGIFDKNYNLLENYLADDINNVLKLLNNYENILFVGDGAIAHKDLLNIKNFEYDNVISKMDISDLESIKNILLTDFDDFWNYTTFKSELLNPNSKYIVAKLDNQIVGFAGIWKALDDVHITNIVTAKKYRNKSIGTKMLAKLIDMTKSEKGVLSITLEVNSNNIIAKKLYEKFGFKVVGLRKKYYNNTDNAIIMTKELKGETNEKK